MIYDSPVLQCARVFSFDVIDCAANVRKILEYLPALLVHEYSVRHSLKVYSSYPEYYSISFKRIKDMVASYYSKCGVPFFVIMDMYFTDSYFGYHTNNDILRGIFKQYYGIEYDEKLKEELRDYEVSIVSA